MGRYRERPRAVVLTGDTAIHKKEIEMTHATPATQPPTMQPFASWNPTRGIWETTQLNVYGLTAPFSAI